MPLSVRRVNFLCYAAIAVWALAAWFHGALPDIPALVLASDSAKACAGIVLLLLVPGAQFAHLVLRGKACSVSRFFLLAIGLNVLIWIGVLTGLHAFVDTVRPYMIVAVIGVVAVIGSMLLRQRWGRGALVRPMPAAGLCVYVVGAGLLMVAIPLGGGPFMAEAEQYWPLTILGDFEGAEWPAEPDRAVSTRYGQGAIRMGARLFRMNAGDTGIALHNAGSTDTTFHLALCFALSDEGHVAIEHAGRLLFDTYAPPPFDPAIHQRNYPPPRFFVSRTLRLRPGENRLRIRYTPSAHAGPSPLMAVLDLSQLARAAAEALFRSHYVIDNIGDTQENYVLGASLVRYPFPRTSSYNGSHFDGGGYTVSNLPFPYYPYAFSILLLGERMSSLHVLYLVEIALLFCLSASLATGGAKRQTKGIILACLGCVMTYAVLMRFMRESVYIHTILTLVVLAVLKALSERDRVTFLIFGTFCVFVKGGLPILAFAICAAMWVFPKQRKTVISQTLMLAGICALVTLGLLWFGSRAGVIGQWQREFAEEDYMERFAILLSVARGEVQALPLLIESAARLTGIVLACSGGMLALVFVRRRPVPWLLTLTAFGIHGLTSVSDPLFPDLEHIWHPLNYFTPAAPLIAAAGLRALGELRPRRRRWAAYLAAAACFSCIPVCRAVARTYEDQYEKVIVPGLSVIHRGAAVDFLLRRARSEAQRSEWRLMSADAEAALAVRHFPALAPAVLRMLAEAHHIVAVDAARQGDIEGAAARWEEGLALNPAIRPAVQSYVSALLRLGRRNAAKKWLDHGLRLWPSDEILTALEQRLAAGGPDG